FEARFLPAPPVRRGRRRPSSTLRPSWRIPLESAGCARRPWPRSSPRPVHLHPSPRGKKDTPCSHPDMNAESTRESSVIGGIFLPDTERGEHAQETLFDFRHFERGLQAEKRPLCGGLRESFEGERRQPFRGFETSLLNQDENAADEDRGLELGAIR